MIRALVDVGILIALLLLLLLEPAKSVAHWIYNFSIANVIGWGAVFALRKLGKGKQE